MRKLFLKGKTESNTPKVNAKLKFGKEAKGLEHLSPREFEEFCQTLLMCHFKCVVRLTPPTGDGGRDLLVQHPSGVLVVECKHYPTGVVGRPVVQKLHSAVLTENARQGMIITTGRFSAEAEDRVKNLQDVRIELVDAAKLAHLISTNFSAGLIPLNLCSAIRTTPEADFSQIFTRSIFAENRYNKGNRFSAPIRVKVKRVTRYLAYYVASFQAEGKLDTAAGTFTKNWEGILWLRADRGEAGFGSPRLKGAELAPLTPLPDVLKTTPGQTMLLGLALLLAGKTAVSVEIDMNRSSCPSGSWKLGYSGGIVSSDLCNLRKAP